jgi:hypothetical protein
MSRYEPDAQRRRMNGQHSFACASGLCAFAGEIGRLCNPLAFGGWSMLSECEAFRMQRTGVGNLWRKQLVGEARSCSAKYSRPRAFHSRRAGGNLLFIVSTSPRRKTGQSWPKSPETTDRSRSVRHRSTCGVNLEGWAPRGWPPFKCTGPPWTKLIIGAAGCATLPRRQTAAEAEDTAQSAAPLERQITNGDSRAFSRTAVAVLPSERGIRVVRRLWLSNAPR